MDSWRRKGRLDQGPVRVFYESETGEIKGIGAQPGGTGSSCSRKSTAAEGEIKGIIPHGGGTKGVVVGSAGTKKGRLLNSPRRPTNNETRAESEVNIVTQILFGESIHVMNERFFRECHFKQEQAMAGAI